MCPGQGQCHDLQGQGHNPHGQHRGPTSHEAVSKSGVAWYVIRHHLAFDVSVVVFDALHLAGKLLIHRAASFTHLVDKRRPSRQPLLLPLYQPSILRKPTTFLHSHSRLCLTDRSFHGLSGLTSTNTNRISTAEMGN